MIEITVYGSGSEGNCTILKDKSTGKIIVMDCGIPMPPKIHLEDVLGVFITHCHSDHMNYIKDWRSRPIYTREDMSDYIRKGYDIRPDFKKSNLVSIGPFIVQCVSACHDTPFPSHYRVMTNDDSVWYGCDAYKYKEMEYQLASRCNKIMVDCNYDMGLMEEYSVYPNILKSRIQNKGHASNQYIYKRFNNVKEKLILMHLSTRYNSPKIVKKLFGKGTKVIDKVPRKIL